MILHPDTILENAVPYVHEMVHAMTWSFTDYVVGKCGLKGLRALAEADKQDKAAKIACGVTMKERNVMWRHVTFSTAAMVN